MKYHPDTGLWCVGQRGAADDAVEPFGVRGGDFEVTSVSDFEGDFKAQGIANKVGAEGDGDTKALLAALRLKKPKRPRPPKAPKLLEFEPDEPEYAEECKFEDLYTDKQQAETAFWDTVRDGSGETRLKYTQQYDELPVNHPCQVAKNAGGVFDDTWPRFGGGGEDDMG